MKCFQFDTTLSRLRSVGFWEGLSSIALFFVAMPLKYFADMDFLIRPVGMVHGLLWIAFVALAVIGQTEYRWSPKTTVYLFIASLLPAGPLFVDGPLLKPFEDETLRKD